MTIAKKINRNDPCLCGSGKKYKKCCGRQGANNEVELQELLRQALQCVNFSQYQKAEQLFKVVIDKSPFSAVAYNELGNLYKTLGRISKAIDQYKLAIKYDDKNSMYFNNIAIAYKEQGQVNEAKDNYYKAIELAPDNEVAHLNLAHFLARQGDEEAIYHYKESLRINPNQSSVHNNLAVLFINEGQYKEAFSSLQNAIKYNSKDSEPHNNLAGLFMKQGRYDDGMEYYRKALELNPDYTDAHSNLLLALNRQELDSSKLYNEHRNFQKMHENKAVRKQGVYMNEINSERKIKLGFVSPDFRRHSVAYFIKPILTKYDKNKFEVICYYNNTQEDEITKTLMESVDGWRYIYGRSDDEIEQLIHDDKIDILVDLSGHTSDNRLPLFMRKPAPIQVSWIGYPNTTGIDAMDYRIVDNYSDPVGLTDPFYTEKLIRMDHSFLCYEPANVKIEVEQCPCLANNYITFGSFNNYAKYTDKIIELWAKILLAVPNSKLLLKNGSLKDDEIYQKIVEQFKSFSVSEDRLILKGHTESFEEHLSLYHQVDIALDTFPYHGTTTTFEALWMGVPTITLEGSLHAARVGVSILQNTQLDNFIAKDEEEYIQLAKEQATNVNNLAALRTEMRTRLLRSSLLNAERFTKELENTFISFWTDWCKQIEESKGADKRPTILDRKLHIGGTVFHEEWEVFNALDAPFVNHVGNAKDLSRFKDETFVALYASHVVEHFDYKDELGGVLREWNRVLKPNGKLYISVPNLDILASLFITKELTLKERFHVMRMIFGGHTTKWDYHYVGLNEEILTYFLKEAGFSEVEVVDCLDIFDDTSNLTFKGQKISLNIVANK